MDPFLVFYGTLLLKYNTETARSPLTPVTSHLSPVDIHRSIIRLTSTAQRFLNPIKTNTEANSIFYLANNSNKENNIVQFIIIIN